MLLKAAAVERLTLVTYDRRTITPLLKVWGEAGLEHGGVVFVDNHTIASSDIGGLVKALAVEGDCDVGLGELDSRRTPLVTPGRRSGPGV